MSNAPALNERIIEPSVVAATTMPTVYYAGRSGYAIESDGVYIPLSETAVGQHLRKAGVKREEVANLLCDIRTQNYVAYIGPAHTGGQQPAISGYNRAKRYCGNGR